MHFTGILLGESVLLAIEEKQIHALVVSLCVFFLSYLLLRLFCPIRKCHDLLCSISIANVRFKFAFAYFRFFLLLFSSLWMCQKLFGFCLLYYDLFLTTHYSSFMNHESHSRSHTHSHQSFTAFRSFQASKQTWIIIAYWIIVVRWNFITKKTGADLAFVHSFIHKNTSFLCKHTWTIFHFSVRLIVAALFCSVLLSFSCNKFNIICFVLVSPSAFE